MKKIFVLFYVTIVPCFLFSQPLEYEWKEVTNKYMRLGSNGNNLNAYTKGGHAVIATDEGWLAESVDTGRSWQKTYDVIDVQENVYNQERENAYKPLLLTFSSDSLNGVFFATYLESNVQKNVLLYSNDGGHSWAPSSTPLENDCRISKYLWYNENTIYALIYNSSIQELCLYVSKDAGNHWNKVTENLMFSTSYNENSTFFSFVNKQLGYLFIDGGYYISTDGGTIWKQVKLDIKPAYLYQFNNGHLLLIVRNFVNQTLNGCRIMNMFDMNDGWIEYYEIPSKIIDLGNGTIWASVSGGYNGGRNVLSTDSLKTWKTTNEEHNLPTITNELENLISMNTYIGNMAGKALYVKSSNEIFVIGTQKGRLFHTKDGGKTWTYKDFNKTLYQMQFISDNTLYLSGQDSLYVSYDGGESWNGRYLYLSGIIGTKQMQFFSEKIGYIYDNTHTYRTQDGGFSWERVYETGDDFWEYESNLGCFANERLGLCKSYNEKVLLSKQASIQKENGLPIFPCTYVAEISRRVSHIMYYKDGERWLIQDVDGCIYVCDTTFKFKKVSETLPDKNTHSRNYYSTMILDYGNGNVILPMLSAEPDFPNDTARVSHDGGDTWNFEAFRSPIASLIAKADNSNVLYACETGRNLHVYKGIHRVKTSDCSFDNQENGTIQCSISNADNQNYTAKVVLEQVNGISIVVNENIEIKSGEAFVITLPQNIIANYVIKVIPEDDEVYETVQSQEFIVNNGGSAIDAVFADDIQIRVVNGKIECSCEEYTIYNVAGQKVQNNASLPSGTYFVYCGTQVKKVVVR